MEGDDVERKDYGWVGFEGVMEYRTSLGRSALLSGVVYMTRLQVCIVWVWH